MYISELTNTWGCSWSKELDGKANYGYRCLPEATRDWLNCVGGGAVTQILNAGLGEVVKVVPGAYGGERRTIEVDGDALETMCRAYWDRLNAQVEPTGCHYCGQSASERNFFGVLACSECK